MEKQLTGRILLIEDEGFTEDLSGNILKNYNYELRITKKAEEVKEILKAEPFDLVIAALERPKDFGFDIPSYMIKEKISVPLVIFTKVQDPEAQDQKLKVRAVHFSQETDLAAELLTVIGEIIRRHYPDKREAVTEGIHGALPFQYFEKRFNEEKQRNNRGAKPFSIALLDLDYFKKTNEDYGSFFGDQILKEFVDILGKNLRAYDQVFHYKEDKFILLFPETTDEEAYRVIERIRSSVKEKVFEVQEGKKVFIISFSCGIAMMEKDLQMEDLMIKADAALYQAKEWGRNQTVYPEDKNGKKPDKVLIVDDDRLIRKLIKTRLVYLGYETEEAADGETALEKIYSFQPDLVLLDIMLPKLTGTEILKKIKMDPSLNTVKVIMVSGKSSDKDILHNIKLGANDFVPKPFSMLVLEEKIKKLL